MTTRTQLIPLRNHRIQLTIDGVEVIGEILYLAPNDIEIEIKAPFSGFKSGLHVPYFAMYESNWLATMVARRTEVMTDRGRQKAEELLRGLYEHANGRPAGWGVDELTPTGWRRVEG
jgi:hypothetical protein